MKYPNKIIICQIIMIILNNHCYNEKFNWHKNKRSITLEYFMWCLCNFSWSSVCVRQDTEFWGISDSHLLHTCPALRHRRFMIMCQSTVTCHCEKSELRAGYEPCAAFAPAVGRSWIKLVHLSQTDTGLAALENMCCALEDICGNHVLRYV